MNDELKQIKKDYGEKMMQLCRSSFATILETPGQLYNILSSHIAPTHTLADDIIKYHYEEEFSDYIYTFVNKKDEDKSLPDTGKDPFELMEEAGYKLFECKNEDDIQSYRHYYHPGEELCTFNGGRLQRCRVFFAVKNNASTLNRDDFKDPYREDLYGTSVISLQFSYGDINVLSIKNRYNHTVHNPDATFNNNLENIIPGLTKSFEKKYRLNIVRDSSSDYNFLTDDLSYTFGYLPQIETSGNESDKVERKLYRYNVEVDGTYFCENNIIIIDGKVIDKYSKDAGRYIIADNYLIDTHEKTIYPYGYKNGKEVFNDDSFTRSIKEVGEIKNITLQKDNGNRVIKIKYVDDKEVFITIDKTNSIIGYKNEYIKRLYQGFLSHNGKLRELFIDNVEIIEPYCLPRNGGLVELTLPNAKYIGDDFLRLNGEMKRINVPKVLELGKNVLAGNRKLEEFNAPSVKKIGIRTLCSNQALRKLYLPEVQIIYDYFINENNHDWEFIYMPKLLAIGGGAFANVRGIKRLNMDSVEYIGNDFMTYENNLNELYLPNAYAICDGFMNSNKYMEYFVAPKLEKFGKESFLSNHHMKEAILECIEKKKPCEVHINNRFMRK